MNINSNYLDPEYNVDNFKARRIVVIKFQILSHNFKTFKKIDIIKIYSSWLFEMYLIDNLMHLTMSTPNKH